MTTQRTLMVLGAGVHQLPGIRKAVERGLRVITVDWDLSNPGHRLSHASAEASTTNVEAVLQVARANAPDGIVTFASDAATGTVAQVAATLGLPGCPPATVRMLSNKGLMRALQHERGLSAPKFASGTDPRTLAAARATMNGPTMIKPVDSSGSRGVTLVGQGDEAGFKTAFELARSNSRAGEVCVEEFLPGEEVGGDAILSGGKLAFIQCTRKWRRDFLVTGHSLPPSISRVQQDAVGRAVQDLCDAAGYTDGVMNFDVMVDGDSATVIEMSPRTGGNGIPSLLHAVTRVDTLVASIAFALGESPVIPEPPSNPDAAGTVVLGLRLGGPVEVPGNFDQARERVPELLEFVCEPPASGIASAWDHGGASFGYCVFRCPPGVSYEVMARRVRLAFGIEESAR
jgi:biotin carboxylase